MLPDVEADVEADVDTGDDGDDDVVALVLLIESNGTVLVLISPKPNVSSSDCS